MKYISRDDIVRVLNSTPRYALLYGPRGTGKTTLAQRAAKVVDEVKQSVYSVTLTSEQSAASVIGHYIQGKGQFEWHDGPAIKAWKEGGLLIINEIDHASEDVSNCLHAILDDFEVAQLTLPTNETVKPKEGFRVIATMNGDPSDLNDAVLDRFSLLLQVTEPSSSMIEKLSDPVAEICRSVYKKVKSNHEPAFTYRQLRAFDELYHELGVEMAAEAVLPDKGGAQGLKEAFVVNRTEI